MTLLFSTDYSAGPEGGSAGAETGWDTNSPAGLYKAAAAETAAGNSFGVEGTSQMVYRKTLASTVNKFRVRWFQEIVGLAGSPDPGANAICAIARLSTTARCSLRVEVGGTYRLVNVSTATGVSSGVITAAVRDRLEWWADGDAGTCGLDWFKGSNRNGTVPDETLSGTFTNATIDNIGTCFPTTIASYVIRQDEVVITDVPGTQIGGFSTGPQGTWTFGRSVLIG